MFEVILIQNLKLCYQDTSHLLSSSNPITYSRNYFIKTLVKNFNVAPFILFYVIFYLWEIKSLPSLVFAYYSHIILH